MEEVKEILIEKPIGVYVKVNAEGYITDVNSDIFITDFEGWQKFDEGYGDKYAHAQNCYFNNSLTDDVGKYIIKYDK